MTERIAFIGTGIMGAPMAGHLLAARFPVSVHNRTRSKAEELIGRGAAWADSPADAAKGADVVFINVPDTPDVEAVITGPRGVLSMAREGMTVVDHSTISPSATRRLAQALSARGATLLDAPVSGGDVGARNATLSIMVGGEESAFARARPLLARLGKTITYCGPSGSGQLTKLTNQILVSVTNLAVSEALVFARKSGLNPDSTIAALSGGAAGSWQLANLGPRMLAGDFKPGFMIDLQVKDLRLVLEAAHEIGLEPAAVNLVQRLFEAAQAQGRGREGTQALFAMVDQASSGTPATKAKLIRHGSEPRQ
jgi:3-hydroxyisobutyrate dehydrogenase